MVLVNQRETDDPRMHTGNKYRFSWRGMEYQRNPTVIARMQRGGSMCATNNKGRARAFPRGVWLRPLSAGISKRTRAVGESRPGPSGREGQRYAQGLNSDENSTLLVAVNGFASSPASLHVRLQRVHC